MIALQATNDGFYVTHLYSTGLQLYFAAGLWRIKSPKGNRAGEIFRQSAQALSTGKHNAIGAFIRRLRGRKGAPVAIKPVQEK
jgi:hypothetical protein